MMPLQPIPCTFQSEKPSVEDARRVAQEVYRLEVLECRPISGGNTNSSFFLETPRERLVMTFMLEVPVNEADALCRLILHLETHDFPTNRIVRVPTGEALVQHGHWSVFLKTRVDGEVHTTLDPVQIAQVGGVLARLHRIPPITPMPSPGIFGQNKVAQVMDLGVDPDYEWWLKHRLMELEALPRGELPCGLVHGDIFADNVIFDTGRPWIIDFESAFSGALVCDLGMAIIGLCIQDGRPDFPSIRALVGGYEQERALQVRERRSLRHFAELCALFCSVWRFWRNHLFAGPPAPACSHREMMTHACHLARYSDEEFLEAVE